MEIFIVICCFTADKINEHQAQAHHQIYLLINLSKIENATIWPELIFIKSVTHSFAFLLWDYVASNDKLTGVCIALKSFADDSSADWSGNSVIFFASNIKYAFAYGSYE